MSVFVLPPVASASARLAYFAAHDQEYPGMARDVAAVLAARNRDCALLAEALKLVDRCANLPLTDEFLMNASDDSLVASLIFSTAQLRAARALADKIRSELP